MNQNKQKVRIYGYNKDLFAFWLISSFKSEKKPNLSLVQFVSVYVLVSLSTLARFCKCFAYGTALFDTFTEYA